MARVLLDGIHNPAVRPDWTPVKPDFDTIPEELRAMPCAVFVLEPRPNGKFGKAPRNTRGFPLSVRQPEKWPTFTECRAAVEAGRFDGVGIPLDGTIIALDVDDIDKGIPPEIAAHVNRAIDEGVFTGKTVSGNGIRVMCKGTMTPMGRRKGQVELYKDVRYITLPLGKGEIKEAQWLVDGVLGWLEGDSVQGGDEEKPAASQTAGQVEVTPAVSSRIEKAVRATLGADVERMRGKYSSDFGDSGADDRSGHIFKVACGVGRKGLEAGVLADEDTLARAIYEVTGRFPIVDEWVDASGSKWERLGEATARNAARAVLKERAGAKPGQVDGDQGEEWPDPEAVSIDKPPVPQFVPEIMLPPVLADYVADHADLMQAPPETIAVPLLVGMGAALGNRVGIQPKRHDPTWMVEGNLYGFVCAPPGRMKSETINRGLAPLKALEKTLADRHKAKRDEWEIAKVRHEMLVTDFKKAIRNGVTEIPVPQAPEEPQEERLVVVDATVAKLGMICAASPGGVLIVRDELTGLLAQLDAMGHEGDREFYLTGWNGGTNYKVDRVSRESLHIPRLTLSLIGGIQPGKLNEYVRQATKGGTGADGLFPRLQVAIQPDFDQPFRNVDRHHDFEAQERACNAARRLFEIDPTAIGAKTVLGTERHYLQFTSEAQDKFDVWREGLENTLRKSDLHPALESHYAKYRSLIPKLALIFHLVEDGTGPVTIDALTLAVRWGNYLKAHAKRIYAGAIQGRELAVKALSDKVKAGKVPNPFTARDVYRACWAGLSDKSDVEPAIEGLLDAGWLREEPIRGPGRNSVRYGINPKLFGNPA